MNNIKDLYKELDDLIKKSEPPKRWWNMKYTPVQMIKFYLLMLLAYPFLGPMVNWMFLKVLTK